MAKLFPDIETIKKLHQDATEGELCLIQFLEKELNDEFEVYFQPMINGDNPDVVVLKKGGGVIIFEVKDWKLDSYFIDEKTNWHLYKNDTPIKSPLHQVRTYKDNFINLHIDKLLELKLKNSYYIAVINCAVYFHCESESKLNTFLKSDFNTDNYSKYHSFLNYFGLWGKDSLTKSKLDSLLNKFGLNRPSVLFDENLYNSFKRYLQPPYHKLEEGIQIIYSKEQQALIKSEVRPRRKIKGLAGSGKTLVLAKRAVNSHIRTNDKVLILTFNLSLKNYIHDRISDVREDFFWPNFYITNYHQFIKTQANNYGLEINSLDPFYNPKFFEPVKEKITPYKALLIDEVQDYQTEWLETLTNYFITDDSEFVVFGDEKQNIYDRPLDENKEPIIKTIRGDWNKSLNTSRRFTSNIGRLALIFQKKLFSQKYSIDELQVIQNPALDFEQQTIEYYFFNTGNSANDVFDKYKSIIERLSVHPSDIAILSSKVDLIRDLDFLIRTKIKEKTETTFETKEYYDKLKESISIDKKLNEELENIRRNKKNHFWMKTGTSKLSTIHSFKGWETHTLFLLIEHEDNIDKEFTTDELIYTGMTRARINLIIFNLGNLKYDNLFKENINKK